MLLVYRGRSREKFAQNPCLGYNLSCNILGRLAQLVERLPYTQNVGSSSLSAPTKLLRSLFSKPTQAFQYPIATP